VTHEASQARRAPATQHPREFGGQVRAGG
jgi:hypothetical protein